MAKIVDILERTVSLSSGMRNADISFDEMTATALVLVSDVVDNGKRVVGLAFDSVGRYAHGALIKERFGPRLLAADPASYAADAGKGIDPRKAWKVLMRNEKGGGHGERAGSVGLMDAALWDLQAKLLGLPLWKLVSREYPGAATPGQITVYASGGHYRPGVGADALADEIRIYQDQGYRRFKIKTGGASVQTDCARVEAALTVAGSGHALSVDFNAGLSGADADDRIAQMSQYGLAWLEEPVDPLDFQGLAELRSRHDVPMATGENLFSFADTRNLIRHGGLNPATDFINVDVSLSYGLVEYVRILDMAREAGWGRRGFLPHAGHLLAMHVAAGLGLGGHETAPSDPLLGGFTPDVRLIDGVAHLGETPGVGFEHHERLGPLFADMLR
jgi:L-alanine-DL-glutamate epimerase-like enolase superfamily enzyme